MVKKQPKPSSTRYNWPALKAEWIKQSVETGITLNRFRNEKRIGNKIIFYNHVEEEGWIEERDKIIAKAWDKSEAKLVDKTVENLDLQGRIYDAGEKQVAFWLQQNVKDGKIMSPLDPQAVAAAMLAAYRALQAKRLMAGKSTGITENRSLIVRALVELQGEVKANNPAVLNSTHTIPGFDPDEEASGDGL
jgi:hypothetical protein